MTKVVLPPVPVRQRFLDADGYVSRPWIQWLSEGLFLRVGGVNATSIGDFYDDTPSRMLAELTAAIYSLVDELRQAPQTNQPMPDDPNSGAQVRVESITSEFIESKLAQIADDMGDLRGRMDAMSSPLPVDCSLPISPQDIQIGQLTDEVADLRIRVDGLSGGPTL